MVQYDAGMFEYDLTNFVGLPGGNNFLATGKSGRVTTVAVAGDGLNSSDATPNIIGNMPTYYQGDRGLLGISLASDYATSKHVFMLWDYCQSTAGLTSDDQACIPKGGLPTGRLSRMTMVGPASLPTGIDFTSEVVLMDNLPSWSPTPGATCTDSHTIGTVIADGSGGLFVGNGDGSSYCGSMDPQSLAAQDVFSPRGKVFHIKEDGSPASGNPFASATLQTENYPVRSEYWSQRVFADGLRNPFRFTQTGATLLTGDVGWNSVEEIDNIGAGQNMGWPCMEGTVPTSLANDPVCTANSSNFTAPAQTWLHTTGGNAAVGGVVTPVTWPSGLAGVPLYGDYAQGDLYTGSHNLFGGHGTWGSLTAIHYGPFGDIYVSDIGKPGTGPGHITRIHNEGTSNAVPTVSITGNPLTGAAPLNVAWSATASDSDGSITTWAWDYGDGSVIQSGTLNPPNGSHTYTKPGSFKAILTVSDNSGSFASASQTVNVGNNPPILTVVQPNNTFHVGDALHVSATATDPDGDGVTVSYQPVVHHCPQGDINNCHEHPGALQSSPDFTFPDHSGDNQDYYLEVVVRATDSRGAVTTQSVAFLLTTAIGPVPGPPTPPPEPPAADGLRFTPTGPFRLFDTRDDGRLAAETPLTFSLSGHKAAVINVTVTNPADTGYLRVYPCSQPPGLQTSTVNYNAGQTVANVAIVTIPDDGQVCAWSQHATDLIIDLSGWFDTDGALAYTPVDPQRVMDTRPAIPFGANQRVLFSLSGAPTDAQAALVNLTVDGPKADGYLRAFPCDSELNTSNVNYVAGQTTSNFAAIGLAGGAVKTWCYRSFAETNVIADISGLFTQQGAVYTPVDPTRLFDTRTGDTGFTRLAPLAEMRVNLGLPGGVTAAVLNVTAADPSNPGYVQVYPCGTVPSTSSVNYKPHQTAAANMTVVKVPASGEVCFKSFAATDLIVDLSGWFTGNGEASAGLGGQADTQVTIVGFPGAR